MEEQQTNGLQKVQAENMRLKKQIKALQKELEQLKHFIGGM